MLNNYVGLIRLNDKLSISSKLNVIHQEILHYYPDITRIAVALYEKERDLLKTFICSCQGDNALSNYDSELHKSPSLLEIVKTKQPRVINDLAIFSKLDNIHSQRIAEQGYSSSYTYPVYNDGQFIGLIFLNSLGKNTFTQHASSLLSPFIHLISLITAKELQSIKVLHGSVCTALDLSHQRDPETGAHLERMSRYSRLIARQLAESHDLTDEYIEYIYRFSPLHDVGKIAIPDNILLKEGPLSEEEFSIMKTHTLKGKKIITKMLNNFELFSIKHTDILVNVVEHHHENVDGTGYHSQLVGEEIPLEARIVSVADVFDALTSKRPYKSAWTNDKSFAELKRLSGTKLDSDCVNALLSQRKAVEDIQEKFKDEYFG